MELNYLSKFLKTWLSCLECSQINRKRLTFTQHTHLPDTTPGISFSQNFYNTGSTTPTHASEEVGEITQVVHADLGDNAGLVPTHRNKANIAIKQVTQNFWFPTAYESYVYAILQAIDCA